MAATAANGSFDQSHHYSPQAHDVYTPPLHKEQDSQPAFKTISNGGIPMHEMAICGSPAPPSQTRKAKRRKSDEQAESESLGGMLRRFAVQHQLGLSLNLMLLVGMSYLFFPSLRESMSAFLWLSYRAHGVEGVEMEKAMYGQGPRDLYLVLSFIVFFTAVRAFMLDYVLSPLAGACGIRNKKGRVRFAEQAYVLLYYFLYWTWGMYLFYRDTPSSLPESAGGKVSFDALLISLWTHFPRLLVDAQMKIYYLSQMAQWVQQILVVHLEEKRKDHYQMLTHHVITVALMSTSYGFRQLRVGNAVLCCMDIVDVVFPVSRSTMFFLCRSTDFVLTCLVTVREDNEIHRLAKDVRCGLWRLRLLLALRTTSILRHHLLEHLRTRQQRGHAVRHVLAHTTHSIFRRRCVWRETERGRWRGRALPDLPTLLR